MENLNLGIRKERSPEKIQVIESDGIKTVLLRGHLYMSWFFREKYG